jgi:hypothetical protein
VRLTGSNWAKYLHGFQRSAFRLELHAVYDMADEEEDYSRFLAGEHPPADLHYPWLDDVAEAVRSGKTFQRVHVVRRPLSGYLRFEFAWGYAFNVRAGEDIRILDLTDKPNPGLPDHDFWFFDEQHVVKMLYQADGTQVARELVESPDIDLYKGYRKVALSGAVPFEEYWPGP